MTTPRTGADSGNPDLSALSEAELTELGRAINGESVNTGGSDGDPPAPQPQNSEAPPWMKPLMETLGGFTETLRVMQGQLRRNDQENTSLRAAVEAALQQRPQATAQPTEIDLGDDDNPFNRAVLKELRDLKTNQAEVSRAQTRSSMTEQERAAASGNVQLLHRIAALAGVELDESKLQGLSAADTWATGYAAIEDAKKATPPLNDADKEAIRREERNKIMSKLPGYDKERGELATRTTDLADLDRANEALNRGDISLEQLEKTLAASEGKAR